MSNKPKIYDITATGSTTPRDIRDRFSDVINVKDFGAVGDGITDDTAAIQYAIDYLDSIDGGILNFPQGTYGITNTIFVKSNITLQGNGRPEIKAINAITGAMIQFGYTTGIVTDPPTNPCINSEINGLIVNANYNVTLQTYNAALVSGVVYVWYQCEYNKIIDCEIKSAECCLVEVENSANFFQLRNCQIHDITSTSVATRFQNLVNIDGPVNALIDNNNIYDLKISGYSPSSWGYALRLHATDNSVVSNNSLDTGYYNLLVDGRSNTIISNRLTNSSNSAIVLYQNDFGCRYNSIINNFIDNDTTASGTVGFGIREILSGSSPDSSKITNNYISGNTIANTGTSLVILNTSGTVSVGNTSITGNPDNGTLGYTPTVNIINDTIKSGTYTPILSNIRNITSSTAYLSQYLIINGVVTISGKIDITPTATGAFDLRISVPVSVNNFSSDAEGAGIAHDTFNQNGCVFSQSASKSLRVQGNFTSTLAKSWWFTATYRIV